MSNFVNNNYISIELNQIRYDLSLIYAKEKLRALLNSKCSPDVNVPKYLLDTFSEGYNYYCNLYEDCFLKQIDITYED